MIINIFMFFSVIIIIILFNIIKFVCYYFVIDKRWMDKTDFSAISMRVKSEFASICILASFERLATDYRFRCALRFRQ